MSSKGLVCSIHKELLKLNSKRKKNPIRKWAKDMRRVYRSQQTHERGSISLALKEMQIKPQ